MKRQDLVFAFMPAYRGSETEAVLLVRSIRRFAGQLKNHPVWVLIPQKLETLSGSTQKELRDLGAVLIPFDIDQQTLGFWFGGKVIASATAESLAREKSDLLVWMDSDTLVLNEPFEFRLEAGKQLGGCPVMLKNISSNSDEPVNRFWELIYRGCRTPAENIFSLTTLVDDVPIRAQFNAGLLVVRPQQGILGAWGANFQQMYRDPQWDDFFNQDFLYRLFLHQAILAGTIMAKMSKSEIQLFSFQVNYPWFLHHRYPADRRLAVLNQLQTCRYDEYRFFEKEDWRTILPIEKPLQGWLEKMIGSGEGF